MCLLTIPRRNDDKKAFRAVDIQPIALPQHDNDARLNVPRVVCQSFIDDSPFSLSDFFPPKKDHTSAPVIAKYDQLTRGTQQLVQAAAVIGQEVGMFSFCVDGEQRREKGNYKVGLKINSHLARSFAKIYDILGLGAELVHLLQYVRTATRFQGMSE